LGGGPRRGPAPAHAGRCISRPHRPRGGHGRRGRRRGKGCMSSLAAPLPTGLPVRLLWGFYDTGVLAWRNLLRVLRNPVFLVTEVVIQPVLFTLLFAYIFGGAIHIPGFAYIDFLMPGIFVQTITFGSMNTATGLAEDM